MGKIVEARLGFVGLPLGTEIFNKLMAGISLFFGDLDVR